MPLNLSKFSLSTLLLTFSLLFSLSLSNPDSTTLLSFKSTSDTTNSLSTWSNSSSSPCSWLGVTCHPSTHRVTKLVLNHLNLTGSIQILTNLADLRHLSLHHNRLSSAPSAAAMWPNLKHLYLSHNNFSGKIPAGILTLRGLRRLDLSYNNFSGEVPIYELTRLPHLLTLRLEFNSLTGSLGSESTQFPDSLSEFNVSGNNLAGKIPNSLSNFSPSSFSGNFDLCGKPLPSECLKPTAGVDIAAGGMSSNKGKKELRNEQVLMMIIAADAVAVIFALVIVTCCCYNKRYSRERKKYNVCDDVARESRSKKEMVCFEGCKIDKVDDLLKSTAEMLGKGSLGSTYKVVMDSGDVVVVKRFRERKMKKRENIDRLLREIGGLSRHTNVVSLGAYCCSIDDELLLVYDFLPQGSLHSLLHGNRGPGRTPLDWTTRLKLASDSAKGLHFLHSQNKPKHFHGHLTPSNILIDRSGNACLSDIGLHRLLPWPSPSNNAYKSPELLLCKDNNLSPSFLQKCDVYSFGVVLLEILTGKMATNEGGESLVKWVRRVAEEEWTWEVFDFEIVRHKEREGEMLGVLKVALLCLTSEPRDRPMISVVYKMLEDILREYNM